MTPTLHIKQKSQQHKPNKERHKNKQTTETQKRQKIYAPQIMTSSRVSTMDKLKSNIMKMKDQATEYIKENPDQVESMKDQAIGALKQTVDKEAEKDDTDADNGTKPSKFNKAKADAINLLKPQLDKLAAEKEEAEAAAAAAAKEEEEGDEVDNDSDDFEETNPIETTSTKKSKSSKNVTTDTNTSSSNIDNVQDLVTEMLSMMDDANLSKEEQKKAVNAFNVAMSFKLI